MKKRTLLFALSSVCLLSGLSGCDKGNEPTNVEHTVTFDPNYINYAGEVVQPVSKKVKHGSKVESLPIYSRSDYTFDGWFTDKNVWQNQIDFSSYIVQSDLSVYGKWSKIVIPCTKIRIIIEDGEEDEIVMKVGDTRKFDVVLTPFNTTETEFTWESSTPEYVSVDEYGYVTANKVTVSDITVQMFSNENPLVVDMISIRVIAA